jgi:hypothetical protein
VVGAVVLFGGAVIFMVMVGPSWTFVGFSALAEEVGQSLCHF